MTPSVGRAVVIERDDAPGIELGMVEHAFELRGPSGRQGHDLVELGQDGDAFAVLVDRDAYELAIEVAFEAQAPACIIDQRVGGGRMWAAAVTRLHGGSGVHLGSLEVARWCGRHGAKQFGGARVRLRLGARQGGEMQRQGIHDELFRRDVGPEPRRRRHDDAVDFLHAGVRAVHDSLSKLQAFS
ncbi:MAG TPA: hypothetical protein VF171_06685 [Trueperaceae bacterium]